MSHNQCFSSISKSEAYLSHTFVSFSSDMREFWSGRPSEEVKYSQMYPILYIGVIPHVKCAFYTVICNHLVTWVYLSHIIKFSPSICLYCNSGPGLLFTCTPICHGLYSGPSLLFTCTLPYVMVFIVVRVSYLRTCIPICHGLYSSPGLLIPSTLLHIS